MQSKLAITAASSYVALFSGRNQALWQQFAFPWVSARRTAVHSAAYEAEPAVHSGEPEDTRNVADPKPAKQETEKYHEKYSKDTDHGPLATTPKPPHVTFSRLESTVVNRPLEYNFQQKRSNSSSTTTGVALEDVSCAGFDGTPLPNNEEETEQTEDDREYFKHRKPSPLSEIEVSDTRKPITRATDGTAGSDDYGGGKDCIGWRPEQLDTADDSLRRATEIWRKNAMRGDPDVYPHSRVLRELRGEWF